MQIMRIVIISLVFTLLLVEKNTGYSCMLTEKVTTSHQMEAKNKGIPVPMDAIYYFMDSDNWLSTIGERPTFSCRVVSIFKQFLILALFKEFYIKQLFKNKLLTREIVGMVYQSQKHDKGYYTYGLGKIRC
jgi:hypothetical protein